MNKELLDQLKQRATVEFPHEMGGTYKALKVDLLAELIVQECISGAEEADNGSGDDRDRGARCAVNAISRKFGVS